MTSPTKVRTTSHSEVESFLSCQRRHFYGYGHEIQGKTTSEALERGILIHAALAAYYEGLQKGLNHEQASGEAHQTLSGLGRTSEAYDGVKLLMECAKLLMLYLAHYEHEATEIEVLDVETEYLVPITDNYSLQVRIDLILRHKGQVIVRDHKVVYDFYNDKKIDMLPQLPKYLAGLWTKGVKIDKLEYNEIRHRTTKENTDDPSQRFRHTEVKITRPRVMRTLEEQLRAANQIASLKSKTLEEWGRVVLRNTASCGTCPFTLLCSAELNGEPTELIKQFEYKPKTKRIEMNS